MRRYDNNRNNRTSCCHTSGSDIRILNDPTTMRHRFVLSTLLLFAVVRAEIDQRNEAKRSKNDDNSKLNSLEDVDLSCDGAKCDQSGDEETSSSSSSGWTTTKKPNIFQLTNKSCPEFELPSIFPRQNCHEHLDCRWPRICCKFNGKKTCRFPSPNWRNNLLKTITKSFKFKVPPYFQCSPTPPKRYDLFPRKCRTTLDCLPELCCPENGKNICRPPVKTIFPLSGRFAVGATSFRSGWPF